ncbi:MAG TPA: ATP-binding protein [Marmoricola sp.]|nr:ATP-binding protein [Marmoricola sp.]
MVIDYNPDRLPVGSIGWGEFLAAIEAATAGDENEWVEFKADLDPTTADGRASLAKAVVAFANRDPRVAQKWFGGHGVVVVGLAPGKVAGTPEIDPADLHNKINALLAAPAPRWEPVYVTYKSKTVLVIVVDPPKVGDPIAVIGKSSGEVSDGNIYVRMVGKSERAKSADVRRLSERLLAPTSTLSDITIEPSGSIARISYPEDWVTDWISGERSRLLDVVEEESGQADVGQVPVTSKEVAATYKSLAEVVSAISTTHPENRTVDQYKAQVEDYLDRCRESLAESFNDLRSTAATKVTFYVVNDGPNNFENLLVELHIEGDVLGYEDPHDFDGVRVNLPQAPRRWGPWFKSNFLGPIGDMSSLYAIPKHFGPIRPRPTIENGGSVSVRTIPTHVRPHSRTRAVSVLLVGNEGIDSPSRATWRATATNMSGKVDGELTIPVSANILDIGDGLSYQPPTQKEH